MFNLKSLAMVKLLSQETPDSLSLEEIEAKIRQGLDQQRAEKNIAGKKIGVLAGSRGIRNIQHIIKAVVKYLQEYGAEVVILPAMGSHGGATAEGQLSLLAHYGISEKEIGVPVVSTMEVATIGDINGHPVFVNRPVLDLDWIVPVNRIKAHTDYHGPFESGLIKMLVIGMGKRAQAEAVHQHGISGLRDLIPQVAKKVLERVPLFGAVGIVENKWDETAMIEVLNAENLFAREGELLQRSKDMLPKIPVGNLDVLVVAQMGKNISGVGIDPNVTGRMRINGTPDEDFTAKRIVVLDLTDESEGNALGMGIADVMTRRLYNKVDMQKTYINTITSGFVERCFIPVVAESDEEAVRIAVQTCGRVVTAENVRIAVITNTLDLSTIYISPALKAETPAGYTVVEQKDKLFDESGDFIQ
ncbi:MAG: lactate racemase domain-containing protein [Negativicutes bacterium]|nr:lactate racemase domain-containing protein [Negativicutes bacterium]